MGSEKSSDGLAPGLTVILNDRGFGVGEGTTPETLIPIVSTPSTRADATVTMPVTLSIAYFPPALFDKDQVGDPLWPPLIVAVPTAVPTVAESRMLLPENWIVTACRGGGGKNVCVQNECMRYPIQAQASAVAESTA